MKFAIYCGSSKGKKSIYAERARDLAKSLVANNIEMVYGAGSVGLMGEIADEMIVHQGKVTGIIPQFLMDLEVGHNGLTTLEVVENMHERKSRMVELSDGFIAMPGGFGTMDEILEVLTWRQLNLIDYPIAFYNINGYFNYLIEFIGVTVKEGFVKESHLSQILINSDPDDLIKQMLDYKKSNKEGKWIS